MNHSLSAATVEKIHGALACYPAIDNEALREHIDRVGVVFYENPVSLRGFLSGIDPTVEREGD